MTIQEILELIKLCKANGVTRFKSREISLRFGDTPVVESLKAVSSVPVSKSSNPGDVLPSEAKEIVHHVNEVTSLLRLSDEDLVDKLFPDYSMQKNEGA